MSADGISFFLLQTVIIHLLSQTLLMKINVVYKKAILTAIRFFVSLFVCEK